MNDAKTASVTTGCTPIQWPGERTTAYHELARGARSATGSAAWGERTTAYHELDPRGEIRKVKDLAAEAIEAGFYNIDIDASTLVDLALPTIAEQQEINARHTAE